MQLRLRLQTRKAEPRGSPRGSDLSPRGAKPRGNSERAGGSAQGHCRGHGDGGRNPFPGLQDRTLAPPPCSQLSQRQECAGLGTSPRSAQPRPDFQPSGLRGEKCLVEKEETPGPKGHCGFAPPPEEQPRGHAGAPRAGSDERECGARPGTDWIYARAAAVCCRPGLAGLTKTHLLRGWHPQYFP